jgi:nucleotide-binding universal stress UspA family protein
MRTMLAAPPVMSEAKKPFKKILCATDFSDDARRAFRASLDLEQGTGGSVTLLHVVQPPWYSMPPAGYGFIETGDLAGQLDAIAARSLDEWRKSAIEEGYPPAEVVRAQGVPWHEIVEFAKRGSYELIVVGTRGRTGVARALLGSVAEKVVRHAPCAVLVVR